MDVERNTNDMLKKALDRRQTGSLSSNFSFRMMDQIRVEAARQAKRKQRMMVLALSVALSLMIGLFVYFVFFYMKFKLPNLMLDLSFTTFSSSPLFGFYTYIALLALGLLGIDFWVRNKKSVSDE